MAYMFPKEMKANINDAERDVYKKLQLGLPDEIACYHNYEVNNMETDFIVMLPGKGIVIIEVKSWWGNRITKIPDAEHIEYLDYNGVKQVDHSPLTQCKNYTYALRGNIQKILDKNIKIIPLVCLPFMNEATYRKKSMQIVVPRDRVILKDDLEDATQLYAVIRQKFDGKKVGYVHPFDEVTYVDVLSEWFEDKQTIMERMKTYKPERKIRRFFNQSKRVYSMLSYLKLDLEEPMELRYQVLEEYFEKWIVGTKIILIVDTKEQSTVIMKYLEQKINQELTYLENYDAFKVFDIEKAKYRTSIFHFEVYHGIEVEGIVPFTLIDGDDYESYHDALEMFDTCTGFNYKQYKIEHASDEGNILIKAGAGTGKTYSMVSRIGFLYYSKNYTPKDLLRAIIMITFTNEAADNMKKRLKVYFTNLALLTEETDYIHMMENISQMRISTIHALMKKIIQDNGKYIGVGSSIKITTERYEKQQHIHAILEELMKQDRYSVLIGNLKKYELRKAIEKFIDLLEKKNINLEYPQSFDTVSKEADLFELIKQAVIYVQQKSIQQHIEENKVHLSNLAIYVDKILREMPPKDEEDILDESKVDYVFVDEFQDTDDVTIDLIKRFYEREDFNLFVVGDIKQSIYRFRGADDEAFTKLQEGMDGWVKDGTVEGDYLTLSKNYRSDSKLLESFHELFEEWTSGVGRFQEILKYDTSDQLTGVKSDERILKPITQKDCTDATFETVLIETINQQLEDLNKKYEDKPDQKGTIAILTRNNKDIETIREIGKKYGKTIETDKVENLYQMAPAMDLYRLILALQYNTNPKYLYSLSLSNYAPTIMHQEVYKNKFNRQHIYQLFKENRIIPNWTRSIEEINNTVEEEQEDTSITGILRQKTILRVIREINKQTRPWERYAAGFTEDQEEHKIHYKRNQDLLLERLIHMGSGDYLTINKLAKYLHIMIFTKQHQDERSHKKKVTQHQIKCLTVHKSKGLEYDHVIIPYTNTELDKPSANQVIVIDGVIYTQLIVRPKDDDRGKEGISLRSDHYVGKVHQEKEDMVKEEARILYVALTRAEDTVTWFRHRGSEVQSETGVTWTELLKKGGRQDGGEDTTGTEGMDS